MATNIWEPFFVLFQYNYLLTSEKSLLNSFFLISQKIKLHP
jgi:hypothetical protein